MFTSWQNCLPIHFFSLKGGGGSCITFDQMVIKILSYDPPIWYNQIMQKSNWWSFLHAQIIDYLLSCNESKTTLSASPSLICLVDIFRCPHYVLKKIYINLILMYCIFICSQLSTVTLGIKILKTLNFKTRLLMSYTARQEIMNNLYM